MITQNKRDEVINSIAKTSNVKELNGLWKSHPELHTSIEFKILFCKKKSDFLKLTK